MHLADANYVAAANGNERFGRCHSARLRELGATDAELVEVLLVVDPANGYNLYARRMRVGPRTRKPFGPNAAANKAVAQCSDC